MFPWTEQEWCFYLIDTLTESRGEEQSIELLKGLFPWRKVGIRKDLERGLDREEASLGRDVIVGQDREVSLGHLVDGRVHDDVNEGG